MRGDSASTHQLRPQEQVTTPSHHPHRVGGWWALAGRESAARSFCSSGSQAQLETVYGWAVPNFAAFPPVVQQHDHGKDPVSYTHLTLPTILLV